MNLKSIDFDVLRTMLSAIVEIDQNEWDALLPFLHTNHSNVNELIYRVGDVPDKMHFLMEGVVRVFYIDPDGNEKNKSLLRKGDLISPIQPLMANQSSRFSTQALTPCTLISIKHTDFNTLCMNYPKWNLVHRMRLERLVVSNERREASLLTLSARARYEEFLHHYAEQASQIPLRHVALYLGITDVALSRIRREMGLTEKLPEALS